MDHAELKKKNARMLTTVMIVVGVMLAASFAAVPAYKLFCQLTGFGGTTMVAESLPDRTVDRKITVKFNADVGRTMPWRFHSDQRQVAVQLGQQGVMSFSAENYGRSAVTGVAVYNVSPPKAGKYFHKLQCFCFGEQSLNPGEKVTYPVVFYIDPALNDDPNMEDLKTITLSYTFFPAETKELDDAIEAFNNDAATAGTVALEPEKQ